MFQLEATAVHWACRGGSLTALQLLLDQGAKFTYRDKVGTHGLEEAWRLKFVLMYRREARHL